jgi:phosphoglycerate dehydrogenase-like enzyme
MASIRHEIGAEAASISFAPRQPATLFADAAALSAYADDTATPDSDADRIVGTVLQLAPRLHAARAACAAGDDATAQQRSVRGLRLGILGPGIKHCALADRLRMAFGVSVSCAADDTHSRDIAAGHGYHLADDVEALLSIADIVVAIEPHTGLRDTGLRIDNRTLNVMQPHAILIADPAVGVDQMALAHALWFETIAGVGIVRSAMPRLLPELEKAHNVVLV